MKALTIAAIIAAVGVVSVCPDLANAQNGVQLPQDGKLNYALRRERVQKSLAERNAPVSKFHADLLQGRRARQSCIAEYQAICPDEDPVQLVAKSKVGSAPKAGARDFQAQADGEAVSLKAVPRRIQRDDVESVNSESAVVRTNRKKRFNLRGMERCLVNNFDKIQNKFCKEFIEGRNKCFAETSDAKCKASVEKVGASLARSSASTSFSVKKLLKSKPESAATESVTLDSLPELAADRARMSCLRHAAPETFTIDCTNSSYFKSIMAPKRANSGLKGILKRIGKSNEEGSATASKSLTV